ncbi:hypothetical protein [Streptomyces sp. NPDC056244]|uniref:hypothetical protein n=1 Tax=Streptomyces sp. NPDC056244 TaxID=3345762 RepID=UPI0035DB62E3
MGAWPSRALVPSRTTVDHALADHERWKQLARRARRTYRRDRLPDTCRAIASLVSDRTAAI